jgi:hypothetical protein
MFTLIKVNSSTRQYAFVIVSRIATLYMPHMIDHVKSSLSLHSAAED